LSKRQTDVAAVHEDEARKFLDRIGLLVEYDDGRLICFCCRQPLHSAGLGMARMKDGRIVLSCASFDCMEELGERE
jgi:hypothetical protein